MITQPSQILSSAYSAFGAVACQRDDRGRRQVLPRTGGRPELTIAATAGDIQAKAEACKNQTSAIRHECESGIARTRSDQPFGWAQADAGIGWNAAQVGGSGACPAEHVPAERNDLCTRTGQPVFVAAKYTGASVDTLPNASSSV